MLTENDVVDAVASHLRDNGWHIQSTSNTSEHGHDILASKDGTTIAIEAKGQTSSKSGTNRYGNEFSDSQKRSHVSRAVFRAASVVSDGRYRAGVALPATDKHLKLIKQVRAALHTLDVTVFFVESDGAVIQDP